MDYTEIKFLEDDNALLKGVNTLAKAVGTTLGPKGRNVAIDRVTDHIVLHDGVEVAKAIHLKDKHEDLGAKILKEAARKTVDVCGDGTTVTIVLAQAIVNECMRIVSAGENPMVIRRSLEDARDKVLKYLDSIAKPIKTLEEKIQVATISAEDERLGELIAKTIDEMGIDGIVTVDESKSAETVVEKQIGMQFDKGYISPYFITDPGKMEATVEEPYILIGDKNLSIGQHLTTFLEEFSKVSNKLVVIAPDIADTALQVLVVNKVRGIGSISAVKAPLFGEKQKSILQDMCALTGATLISDDAGMSWQNATLDMAGQAERVTSTVSDTLIVGGKGDIQLIGERIKSLKEALKKEQSPFEQEKLKERIAKLTNGVAIIRVGGDTEIEMKERKERVKDAVLATKAAVEEGIVAGGEVALLSARGALDADDSLGARILTKALFMPFKKLMENAGLDAGEQKSKLTENGIGIDVLTGEPIQMIEAGIVDPKKVVASAVKNAVSVGIQIITTGCSIIPIESKNDK